MNIRFKTKIKCEAFFFFAISSIQDFKYVEEILSNFCERFLQAWPVQSLSQDKCFSVILNILRKAERIKLSQDIKKISFDNYLKKHEDFKRILNYYNFMIADDILDLIKSSNQFEIELTKLVSEFDKDKIIDKNKMFNESKIIIFCLTKTYFESKLFQLEWNRAKTMNKYVLLLLLENHLKYNYIEQTNHFVFDIYDSKQRMLRDIEYLPEDKLYPLEIIGLQIHLKCIHDCLIQILNRELEVYFVSISKNFFYLI